MLEKLLPLPSSRTIQSPRANSAEASTHQSLRPGKPQFLQLDEWTECNGYDEEMPTCIHYSIEWKVSVNNKVISRATEQDQVLAPTAYWYDYLKPKLDKDI
jgi:hypothetical protein